MVLAGAGPVYCRGGSGDQHNAVRPLPYLAIVLAFVGGIVMVPASVIFLVGSLFSLQTRINAGFTPWRSTTAVGEADNQQLLTFNASGFYPQGALALIAGIIILMIGMGIGGV